LNTRLTPFAFDRVYAADGTVLRDGERIKRMLTPAEAEEKAQEAAKAALAGETAEAARQTAEAVKVLCARIQTILVRMDTESALMRADAARLAVAAARRIAGVALDRFGDDTIADCAASIMDDLRAEPRIAVRVAPNLADPVAERLYTEAQHRGFEGAVVVRADDEVAVGDCVLEWRAGSVERTAGDIETRISEIIERWLASPAAQESPLPESDVKDVNHG
jgi:flagellar assembly protein FliH